MKIEHVKNIGIPLIQKAKPNLLGSDTLLVYNAPSTGQGFTQTARVQLTNIEDITDTFQLSVDPPGAVTFSQPSVTLAPGAIAIFTVTPQFDSSRVGDVLVSATGKEVVFGVGFTIASVTFGTSPGVVSNHIRNADTPASMTQDRIPPDSNPTGYAGDTPVYVNVSPNLGVSGLSVTLAVNGQSANNGRVTIDGNSTEDITSSGVLELRGTSQTAGTGLFVNGTGMGVGGNAAKLQLAIQVSGQNTIRSNGFSVAAIPVNFSNVLSPKQNAPSFGGLFNEEYVVAGMKVIWNLQSDSGDIDDLGTVNVSEQVQLDNYTGIFGYAGLYEDYIGFTTSQYMTAMQTNGNTDTHNVFIPIPTPITSGLLLFSQLFTFEDTRTGVNNIPMENSGFTISQDLYYDPTDGMETLTTRKVPTSVSVSTSAGNFQSGAGTGDSTSRTQVI